MGPKAADRLIRLYDTALGAVEAAKAGPLCSSVGTQYRSIRKKLIEGEADVRISRALVELVDVPQLRLE